MASYTIKSGDTLSQIAKNNNTTVAAIQAANPSISNPNKIYAGQSINIPGQSAAPAAKPTGTLTSAASDLAQNKPPDYSQYKYDASSDTAYQQALGALQAVQKNTPIYAGTWDTRLEDIYNQIVNREKFSYDLNADALYHQYKDQYTHQGQMAMMDTMGQAAAMTGGYGNSYAQSVGQQAYQGYLQRLNDVVPELYGMALDQYNQEGQDLLNQFSMAGSMRDNEYGMYQDDLSNWWKNVDYHTGRADSAYDQGYTNWYNAWQMGVAADDRAYQIKQDAYEKLVTLITTTGYTPSAEELTAAGMSNGEATAYLNYYKEQKGMSSYGGSGGSSGGSSKGGSSKGGSSGGTTVGDAAKTAVKDAVGNAMGAAKDAVANIFGGGSKSSTFSGSTYSEAVAFMKKNGVPSGNASGVMTQTEWARRKASYKNTGTGGAEVKNYNSYKEYLQDFVNYAIETYGK